MNSGCFHTLLDGIVVQVYTKDTLSLVNRLTGRWNSGWGCKEKSGCMNHAYLYSHLLLTPRSDGLETMQERIYANAGAREPRFQYRSNPHWGPIRPSLFRVAFNENKSYIYRVFFKSVKCFILRNASVDLGIAIIHIRY